MYIYVYTYIYMYMYIYIYIYIHTQLYSWRQHISTLAFWVSIRDLTNSPEGSLERSALGGAARPSSPNHRTPTAFAPRHGGDVGSGLLGLLVGLGRWLVRFVLSPNQFCCFECSKPLERKAKDTVSNREVSCFLSKEAYGPEHLEPWDVRMAELQESLVMPCFHEAYWVSYSYSVRDVCSSWRVSWPMGFYPQGQPHQPY